MLKTAAHRLVGEVRVRVTSGFPERVLNLCSQRGISLWDVCWASPTEFVCSMTRRDLRALRLWSKNLDCALKIEKKAGVPFFLGRFQRRYVLVFGLLGSLLLLIFGSFFIWDFQIEGNETIPDEEILRCLEKHGVSLGTFGFAIDSEDLRNHILPEMPDLVWLTVNVTGCQAHVQVRERTPVPEPVDKQTPQNLVARRDGLVLRATALDGVKQVLPGTTVAKGQLLISGVEDTGTFGARIQAGLGSVTARTWYTLRVKLPLTVPRKTYLGGEETDWAVIFGTHRINFFGNSGETLSGCDKIRTRTRLRLFGLALPVTVEKEVRRPFNVEPAAVSEQDAQRRGEAILTEYLHSLVDGEITSSLCTARRDGDCLLVTLTAECREEIGQAVPILTEEQPE